MSAVDDSSGTSSFEYVGGDVKGKTQQEPSGFFSGTALGGQLGKAVADQVKF